MIGGQGEDFRGKRNLARKLIAVSKAIHTRAFIQFVRL
ncbi:hypothetical protein HNP21_001651 [Bacillus aryabhattai]|uniref:Uncharacterized protein n=2 Tax=Priestia TaxID=2800373 RepID=D5DQY3_PRIM1|nr:hypothetical protein BMQ_2104 [Priestia megaterium QM B1551]MBA9038562.1 hypothetical protein [Priestia aryabhattai]MDH6654909.1 hypothetical protein [Bacillus sp. PvP124]MDP9574947.1 hypothetical protein [Bacillus sp. 1751]MDR7203745.1 hypothetical protein [Priestia megaterium]